MATADAFRKAAQDYADKYLSGKTSSEPVSPSGTAVVGAPPSQTHSVLDAIYSAADTPIIQPVVWPPNLPANHPIRSIPLHVRLWNAVEWATFWDLQEVVNASTEGEARNNATSDRFWYIVAISACDNYGQPVFKLPEAIALQVASKCHENAGSDDEITNSWLGKEVLAKHLTSRLAEHLKERFDGPNGWLIVNPIEDAAMMFNGLRAVVENREAKNSDTTANSEPSTES